MRPRLYTPATIRKAVSLLVISVRPTVGMPFHQRLFVVPPPEYEPLDQHDLDTPYPPIGLSTTDYDWMKPVCRVMREARKRHLLFRTLGILPRLQDRLRAQLGRMPTEVEIAEDYRAFLLHDLLALQGASEPFSS
jgi:hypothetical protein